ncbi:hypothetical protein [Candidatus Halobonum tyrrellensis]|uniref:Uncharacterized protein n=1 Tax=Candidatus Halobonum tyrrellensis G22 TaxID=1324957 RepID=V4GNI3_9EURY|nr:hypothetical protein [Candidatus Halobonum tyrrellensis]ESP86951.1 hypothetical protein K933_16862 [Candidatus Halobonum tyrrellensis G22]
MSRPDDPTPDDPSGDRAESTHREYVLDVRIVECTTREGATVYRFEAPHHRGIEFDDPDLAELYADVYFDVNGFEEAGTGERGVPPEIIQAGRDTLVAYFLTQPYTDVEWIASYYGEKPEKVERYVNRVRKRGTLIRDGVEERGLA